MEDDVLASCHDLSLAVFEECIQTLCPKFNISTLTDHQFKSLYNFVCGNDVFVSLPTGSGKSMVFYMAPIVCSWLASKYISSNNLWILDGIIIIISPLTSLMEDQVTKLRLLGFKAASVSGTQDERLLTDVEDGKFTYVFLSPKSALESERWRSMLTSETYSQRLIGIAVDEVHCVIAWGLSNSNANKTAFRRWFSRLNEIRSLVRKGLNFLALTATASRTTREKIFELLELDSPKVITESPNKENIRYSVDKLDRNVKIIENFRGLITEIKSKGKNATRCIIYCQTIKQCSILYRSFEYELGQSMYCSDDRDPRKRLVDMMHSGSPESVKAHVLNQFSSPDSHLRILIATIAYGMGVDCKGVNRIIHFGPPKTVEAYLQESGRCGRKGEPSDAILLYDNITIRAADDNMREYIKGNSCRRNIILKHFDSPTTSSVSVKHRCCDVCLTECKCNNGSCDEQLFSLGAYGLTALNKDIIMLTTRTITEDQMTLLNDKLVKYCKKLMMKCLVGNQPHKVNVISSPTVLLEFGSEHIKQIIENAESIFSLQDIYRCVDIWQSKHAIAVLDIFQSVFNDTEQPTMATMSSSYEDNTDEDEVDEWEELVNDSSFIDLLDQPEWQLDSFSLNIQDISMNNSAYPSFLDNILTNI